jgi:hypothetical protein
MSSPVELSTMSASPPPASDSASVTHPATLDPETWQDFRRSWTATPETELLEVDHGKWSAFELAACTTIQGYTSFPTVGPIMASLDEKMADTITQVIVESFVARQLISAAPDGTAVLTNMAWFEPTVVPDLTIAVESNTAGAPIVWFGFRPDQAVRIIVDSHGTRAVHEVDPRQLVQHVLALFETNPEAPDTDEPLMIDAASVTNAAASGTTIARITSSWMDGGRIVGGVFVCAVDQHGACWEIETGPGANESKWIMRPLVAPHGLRDLVMQHLPGA